VIKQKVRDSLILNYRALNDDGRNMSKSNSFNNLSDDISDEDLFGIAKLLKNALSYGTESVHRVNDFLLLDD